MINKNKSRTENFSKNAFFALFFEAITAVLSFVVRWFFVRNLGSVYLGMGSLFTNILTVLSLAEMGVGSAIIFSMYKPVSEHDIEKIKSLMKLYKKLYLGIGIVVLVVGLVLIPLLPYLIKEMPDVPYGEFISIYVLTVANSAVSYFFVYKQGIFTASQRGRTVKIYNSVFAVVRSAAQIVSLVLVKNYIVYLAISIASTLVCNIIISIKANKEYPYLKESSGPLDEGEKKNIKKNVFSMFLYKSGITVATTIDTLLISGFFGLATLGIYSNYHLIVSYSDKLFSSGLGAVTPSLGNFMVEKNDKEKNQLFSTLQLIYYWIATYLAVGLVVLFNPLIGIVFGDDYLLSFPTVIALVISITLTNFQRPCSLVRDAAGLFWYGKFRPLIMAFLNIGLSLLGIYLWGLIGIVIGTALSKLLTYVWYDPYIVYKHAIKGSLSKYFIRYAMQWGLLIGLTFLCYFVYSLLPLEGIWALLVGALMITVVVNGIFLIVFWKNESMQYLLEHIKLLFRKKQK